MVPVFFWFERLDLFFEGNEEEIINEGHVNDNNP